MIINRNIIFVTVKPELNQFVSCFLKLRSHHMLSFCHIDRKGNKGRRYINFIEGTGHTVFTANGGKSESKLCIVCAKQCCKRLAPAFRIGSHSAEVFLKGKAYLTEIPTACYNFRKGFRHCINGSMIRAPGGQVRIKSIAHHGYGVGLSL